VFFLSLFFEETNISPWRTDTFTLLIAEHLDSRFYPMAMADIPIVTNSSSQHMGLIEWVRLWGDEERVRLNASNGKLLLSIDIHDLVMHAASAPRNACASQLHNAASNASPHANK